MTSRSTLPWQPAALGLMAALGYGFQNAVAKPATSQFGWRDGGILWLIIVSQVVVIAIGLICALANSSVRRDLIIICRRWRHYLPRILAVSAIGMISLLAFLYCMSSFDQVFVSTVLNVFPFWLLIIEFSFFATPDFRRGVTPGVWMAFGGCAFMVVTVAVCRAGWSAVPHVVVISVVPICYALIFLFRRRFFERVPPLSFLIASQLFDAPFVIVLCAVGIWFLEPTHGAQDLLSLDIVLYAAASAGSAGALYCLHKGPALELGPTWLTSFMLFLTPLLTAGFSFVVMITFGYDLTFSPLSLLAIPVLGICLWYLGRWKAEAGPPKPTTP